MLEVTIDNPNSVELVNLCLRIKELTTFKAGLPLEQSIPANQRVSFNLAIPGCPELPPDYPSDRLFLSGELTFCFAQTETGTASLEADSAITIQQIFSSGGVNIDEFL